MQAISEPRAAADGPSVNGAGWPGQSACCLLYGKGAVDFTTMDALAGPSEIESALDIKMRPLREVPAKYLGKKEEGSRK